MRQITEAEKKANDLQEDLEVKAVYSNTVAMHGSNAEVTNPHATNHIGEGQNGLDRTGFSVTLTRTAAEQNAKSKVKYAGGEPVISYFSIDIAPNEICFYHSKDTSFPLFKRTHYESLSDADAIQYLHDMGIRALLVSGSGNDGSLRVQDTTCLTFIKSERVPVYKHEP